MQQLQMMPALPEIRLYRSAFDGVMVCVMCEPPNS
jgi:hypothetical protein